MIKNIDMMTIVLSCLYFILLKQGEQIWMLQKWYRHIHGKAYFNVTASQLFLFIYGASLVAFYLFGHISIQKLLLLSMITFWCQYFFQKVSIPKSKKKTAESVFYLYKFLIQQITAGIRPQDALLSMYIVIEDPKSREVLKKFSVAYQSTYDFSNSKRIIEQHFKSEDIEHFGNIVDEGIKTGDMMMALMRQEKLIFNKYMGYIEEMSYIMRVKLAVLIIVNCLIMIVWIGLPIVLEFIQATQTMFI